jgi:RsiW-degrading membrane proteinase PrsW (M82 family)
MTAGVLALDRIEPEPKHLLITTFLWGAGVSIILSLIFQGIGAAALSGPFSGQEDFLLAVILAPITEEITKGLVLFGLFWFRRHEINGITDGVVYAALAGLGFAAAENVGYYLVAASEGSLVTVFILRGIISPIGHPIYTAMTGIGIALAVRATSKAARVFLPLGGLALAIILHAMWNAAAMFSVGAVLLVLLLEIAVMVVILVMIRRERKATVNKILYWVAQYIPTGLVTEIDLAMLSSLKQRKVARDWARSSRGKQGLMAMRDYQLACTELSELHDRLSRGQISAPVFEVQRQNLLALMKLARDAFLGPQSVMQQQPVVQAQPAMQQQPVVQAQPAMQQQPAMQVQQPVPQHHQPVPQQQQPVPPVPVQPMAPPSMAPQMQGMQPPPPSN